MNPMSAENESPVDSLDTKMDASNLWKEEVITDRRIGVIRVLRPITDEGEPDAGRKPLYVGEAQVMTAYGPMPVNFDIPGETLREVVANYESASKKGVEDMVERLREMRREAANRIVTPGMPGFQAPPETAGGSGIVMP